MVCEVTLLCLLHCCLLQCVKTVSETVDYCNTTTVGFLAGFSAVGGNRGRAMKKVLQKVSQQKEVVGKFPRGGRKTGTVMCRNQVETVYMRVLLVKTPSQNRRSCRKIWRIELNRGIYLGGWRKKCPFSVKQ